MRTLRLTLWPLMVFFLAVPERSFAQPAQKADTSQTLIHTEILKTRRTRINVYPFLFYTPETEFAFGVGGLITFYTSEYVFLRPSKISVSAYYSTKKQYRISFSPQIYFARNKFLLSANLDYGYYVDKFWGVGNDTPDIEEENYASRAWGAEVSLQLPPGVDFIPHTKTGFIYDFLDNTIEDKRANPYLLSGSLTGSEGGISSGLGMLWVWDNRDHIFYPTRGGYHQARAIFYMKAIGSEFDFNRYLIDLRQYLPLSSKSVLALQGFGSFVRGNPPFYELSTLGGAGIMRGYYQGRYRDRAHLAGQVEYRTDLWWRFGLAGFAALGDVSDKLHDFRIDEAKFAGGFGLRFKFNEAEKVNLRADIGFGKNTSGVYFSMEEAF